jgi:hypothetical protein
MDLMGLLQQDVDNALTWLQDNFPELTNGVQVKPSILLNYLPWDGSAVGDNTLYLQQSYLTDCLTEGQEKDLFRTLVHEALHNFTYQYNGFWPTTLFSPGSLHDWIYYKTAEIQQIQEGVIGKNTVNPTFLDFSQAALW